MYCQHSLLLAFRWIVKFLSGVRLQVKLVTPIPNYVCMQFLSPMEISNSYSTVVGIYGSKPTEPEGAARGQGRFTVAINP